MKGISLTDTYLTPEKNNVKSCENVNSSDFRKAGTNNVLNSAELNQTSDKPKVNNNLFSTNKMMESITRTSSDFKNTFSSFRKSNKNRSNNKLLDEITVSIDKNNNLRNSSLIKGKKISDSYLKPNKLQISIRNYMDKTNQIRPTRTNKFITLSKQPKSLSFSARLKVIEKKYTEILNDISKRFLHVKYTGNDIENSFEKEIRVTDRPCVNKKMRNLNDTNVEKDVKLYLTFSPTKKPVSKSHIFNNLFRYGSASKNSRQKMSRKFYQKMKENQKQGVLEYNSFMTEMKHCISKRERRVESNGKFTYEKK